MNSLSEKIQKFSKPKLIKFFNEGDISKLHSLKLYLDDIYYNTGESIVDDWRYDILKETLIRKDPNYIPPVGAKIRSHENRVNIPYWMGSADKITPLETDKYNRWMLKNKADSYIVSDKLDGVSGLFEVKNGIKKLYTRGDGEIGADISYLIQYFNIPNIKDDIVVRGEMIMSKNNFKPYYRTASENKTTGENSNKKYRNARNMVTGLIGSKTVRKGLNKVHFVAYEIISNSQKQDSPESSLKKLKSLGFQTVWYKKINKLSLSVLSKLFLERRKESSYDIDGLIIQSNTMYKRNDSGNPSYSFAFKESLDENIHQTTVKYIEWNISKWGQLKPVVVLEPVVLPDITISRATAHNAVYVEENKIGPGTVIKVTRSKDVIPYIVEIVKSSKNPQMPDKPYVWDKNHVNIMLQSSDKIMCIKLISDMFAKLGIKQVSQQSIAKMFDAGFDNLLKILNASIKDLSRVEGFKERSAQRAYDNIHNGFKNIKLSILLGSSGIFGFGVGRKRIDLLLKDIPNLFSIYKTISKNKLKEKIMNIEGFSDIMADKVVENIKFADIFIKSMKPFITIKKEKKIDKTLDNMKIVMSGFRDKKLEEDIGSRGGKIVGSVSKNTSILLVKSVNDKLTGKSKKASDLGIPIMQKEEFIKKYINK